MSPFSQPFILAKKIIFKNIVIKYCMTTYLEFKFILFPGYHSNLARPNDSPLSAYPELKAKSVWVKFQKSKKRLGKIPKKQKAFG